ncbi:MAG TPA: RDD family protein [Intrasporangium sp.]|uniref:RDD family protein n=1 Tax=Intrasporangium sp. TaxID=1925024 RepID=UPI002D79B11E|nr:RDD family protein [Intrasporangium sp.]HET7397488.1 RDD family protein [Intrasporangium sp.]
MDRRDIGAWLEGPRARTSAGQYPGQGLGMPPSGPGAIGTFGRRLVAVLVDWTVCQLIAAAFLGVPWGQGGPRSFLVLAVFALENLLLVGTLGFTLGHRAAGLQVRGLSGGRATFLQVLARTVLLCLFLPAVFWDRDGRGLHDRVPNTVIVRTR